MRVLVTGVAGFIGFHTAQALLDRGVDVVGLDNLNPYYDVSLKEARLRLLEGRRGFRFYRLDLADRVATEELFARESPGRAVHLAAQAGVRYGAENPHAYASANLTGFLHVLEGCRQAGTSHLVFASTSSVYGANTLLPFDEHQNTDHPLSLYAATKKANEAMAHSYAHLYGLPVTGLRFFTVYGPWGRPDMALFLFTRKILAGEPIDVFGHGRHARDFTYVDDAVDGVLRVLERTPTPDHAWRGEAPDPASSAAPYRIYNTGNGNPVELEEFIAAIEEATGRKAVRNYLPPQPGDVPRTAADITALRAAVGFNPQTPVREGVRRFVAWYRAYYKC